MVDEHEVVLRTRVSLIETLQWAGPEVVDAVLSALARVVYRDDDTYAQEVVPLVVSTVEKMVRPRIEALQESTRILNKHTADLNAQHEKWLRDFEEFKKMKTPKRPQ